MSASTGALARLLEQATGTKGGFPTDAQLVARMRINDLAPDAVRLAIAMAAFIRGDTPDDECDIPGCTAPWECDHDAEALLARFAALEERAAQ